LAAVGCDAGIPDFDGDDRRKKGTRGIEKAATRFAPRPLGKNWRLLNRQPRCSGNIDKVDLQQNNPHRC